MNKMTHSMQAIPFYATHADDQLPLLRVRYSMHRDEETVSLPLSYCSVQIDANGSGDTKLIVLVNIGSSSTVYDQYQFSGHTSGIADPDGVDGSPTHTQCTTLQALVDALNALDGVYAERMHGAADYSTNTDDFIDKARTQIGGNPFQPDQTMLYRDVSELAALSFRIGVPDCTAKGAVAISGIEYSVNGGGTDAITLKISEDQGVSASSERVVYGPVTLADGTPGTIDWHENPMIFNGPLLFEVASNGSLTANDYVTLRYHVVQQ